jgi:hypothetical protein
MRPKGNRGAPTCHCKVAGRVEGCNILPDVGPCDLLQSTNCKNSVQRPTSGGCWLLGTIVWQIYKIAHKSCIFSCIIWYTRQYFSKNFKIIYGVWYLYSRNCFQKKRRSEVVKYGEGAAAYVVEAPSIWVPASDRWEKRERPGSQKWRTAYICHCTAPHVGWTGALRYETIFFRLTGLRHNCGLHAPPTATYVVHIFQANFELHLYDVEKWAASRWNYWQLKIGRRQLDLWHKLYSWNSSWQF